MVFAFDLDKKAGAATAKEIGATVVACDVSSSQAVSRAIKAAAKKSGHIDVLCNNAAYIGQWHNAVESPDSEWDKCYRVSLMGAEYCTREVLPLMVKQKSGAIINISSIQGLVGGRNSAAYTTIKHGLIVFTRSVAYDFGAHNIRCNAICPGA